MHSLNTPQELQHEIYWLGLRRNVRLETNTYLLHLTGKGKTLPILVDPGGPVVFEHILKRLRFKLGDLRKLRAVFLSHQEPDAGLNMAYLLKQHSALLILCTDDVWRMAYTLGVPANKFQSVEKLKDGCLHLTTGHVLRFLPVPFCPSRGACMLYDEQNRVLFSGGLFGGVTFTMSLFATSQHWEGIRLWHQMYIPSQKALQHAIRLVRELDPPPVMIAPQHGAILQERMIPAVLDKLAELPVGLDLSLTTDLDKMISIEAMNNVLNTIAQRAGQEVVDTLLARLHEDYSFPHLFTVKDVRLTDLKDDILGDVMGAFKMVLYALVQDQPQAIQEIVREAVLRSNWNLPLLMPTFVHYANRDQT